MKTRLIYTLDRSSESDRVYPPSRSFMILNANMVALAAILNGGVPTQCETHLTICDAFDEIADHPIFERRFPVIPAWRRALNRLRFWS